MGSNGAGKTSMKSIIFADLTPHLTSRLPYTVDISNSAFLMLDSLSLDIWDCGG